MVYTMGPESRWDKLFWQTNLQYNLPNVGRTMLVFLQGLGPRYWAQSQSVLEDLHEIGQVGSARHSLITRGPREPIAGGAATFLSGKEGESRDLWSWETSFISRARPLQSIISQWEDKSLNGICSVARTRRYRPQSLRTCPQIWRNLYGIASSVPFPSPSDQSNAHASRDVNLHP